MKEKNSQKGAAAAAVVGIIVAVLVIGVLIYFGTRKTDVPSASDMNQDVATTTDMGTTTPATTTPVVVGKTYMLTLTGTTTPGGGKFSLVEDGGMLKVAVMLADTASSTHPADIRAGICGSAGPLKYSLSPVASGTSETSLPLALADLTASTTGSFYLALHKSAKDLAPYACGNIAAANEVAE